MCCNTTTRYNSERPDGVSFGHSSVHNAEDAIDCCSTITCCFLECQDNINEDYNRGRKLSCCIKQIACISVGLVVAVTAIAAMILAAKDGDYDAGCFEICKTLNGLSFCSCI
ncbi:MAG: hypothetical protein H0X29_09470 [Parachlamydiaceae bacterium]|nr:hypothetical protein [Parachlamydiaceae bacterium]